MGDYFRVFFSLFSPFKGLHLTSMEIRLKNNLNFSGWHVNLCIIHIYFNFF